MAIRPPPYWYVPHWTMLLLLLLLSAALLWSSQILVASWDMMSRHGPSLMDWCEPNFVHSEHVAEWYNTITNIPYVLIGIATIFLASPNQQQHLHRLRLAGLALIVIGLGSMVCLDVERRETIFVRASKF